MGELLKMPTSEQQEREQPFTIEVMELAPNGLEFGEGPISTKVQLKNPELSNLTPEGLEAGAEIIKSGIGFVEVDPDANDDGCGDGRPTAVIYQKMLNGVERLYNKSRRRAKIFGGGLVAATSMLRTVIRGRIQPGDTVLQDRVAMADTLDEKGVHHGGHTDNHASGEDCGCGAIDKYPAITANALKFRKQITRSIEATYKGVFAMDDTTFARKMTAVNEVFASYEDQVANEATYFADASGKKTIELMEKRQSVIKELADDHLEDFVVINDIEGTTFDQRMLDDEMTRRGVKGTAQAFVVDSWRGRMYAELIADIAEKEHEMDWQQAYDKAEADFWVRTLAVSGTLTKGDQPVFMRRKNYEIAA